MSGQPKKKFEDPCNELKWKYEKDVKRSGRQICRNTFSVLYDSLSDDSNTKIYYAIYYVCR